jgi:hypothetical protein
MRLQHTQGWLYIHIERHVLNNTSLQSAGKQHTGTEHNTQKTAQHSTAKYSTCMLVHGHRRGHAIELLVQFALDFHQVAAAFLVGRKHAWHCHSRM